MKYGEIGTLSHGTMRKEDLIPDFLSELDWLSVENDNKDHQKMANEIQKRIDDTQDYYESEESGYDLEDLFDALNEYALPYFYFGSHPGDSSDYGFWLSDEIEYEFDGLQIDDVNDIPEDYTGEILYINDHGNTTLFYSDNGKLKEVWSIV